MIEVSEHLNAVRRQVGSKLVEAGELNVVTVGRTFAGEVEEVWNACTTAERLERWFLPVTGDLRLGGRYQLEGNAGGTIERCEPPSMFAATWEYGGTVSWIELRLTPDPAGGTRFELDHLAHEDDHWKQYGPGAVGIGYELALMALATHLAGKPIENGAEFGATEEGLRLSRVSGEAWGEAAIAAGQPAEEARAAAARTVAAYTGG
ncbi:SRPBCC family protein [Kribbella deserti]|uniref:SRPBCC family protein n=1 Tax=Kribbella deserti TaxID=1926257 RepID=A0ABV6QTE4_9ACTN